MKKIYAFGDTETTGTNYTHDQILDWASVFMEKNTIVEEINTEILVKNNNLPNPKALLVNNLNPFTDEFKNKAITENKAINLFIDQVQKYTNNKDVGSLLFMYYNAPFDVQMISEAFKRNGKDFNKLVPVVFDLYILAKHLIDKGLIKPKMGDYGPSGKLGDVYEALGFSKASMNAHNALGDTIILPAMANKMYMLFNGKEMSEIEVDPSTFQELSIQSVVFVTPLSLSRSRSLQLVNKTFIVVKNDIENRQLHILDSTHLNSSSVNLTKTVEVVSYAQIFDETLMNTTQTKLCQKYLVDNKTVLDEFKLKLENIIVDKSLDLPGFDKVIELCEKLRSIKDISQSDIDNLTADEKLLLTQAEDYAYAKYNDGWSVKIKGPYYKDEIKLLHVLGERKIHLDPVKEYFFITFNNEEEMNGSTKSLILKHLVDKGVIENKSEEHKLINSILSEYKDLKNEKSLKFILKEFDNNKVETFNGANKLHKEILSSLLAFYQLHYPKFFKEVTVPNFKLNLNGFKKKV